MPELQHFMPSEDPGIEYCDEGTHTSLESSHIISLVRKLLGPEINATAKVMQDVEDKSGSAGTAAETPAMMDALQERDKAEKEQEEAGEQLWDMALGAELADVMVNMSSVLDVIHALLEAQIDHRAKHDSPQALPHVPGVAIGSRRARLLECCLGIMANIVCHSSLSPTVAAHAPLLDLITAQALWLAEAPPLTELCRAASVALRNPGYEQWLQRLSTKAVCLQLLWIVANTLDPQLHARALDLIVALLHAEQKQRQELQQGQQGQGQQQQQGLQHGIGQEEQQQRDLHQGIEQSQQQKQGLQQGVELEQQQQQQQQQGLQDKEKEERQGQQGQEGQQQGENGEEPEQQQQSEQGQGSTEGTRGVGRATSALLEGGLLGALQTVLQMAAQGKSTRTSPLLGWGRTPSASVPHRMCGQESANLMGATPGSGAPMDVELTDDAVDAALRTLEELVADPACLPAVVAQEGLPDVLLGLLHADSSSQVIESLLLILLDLRQASVPKLSRDVSSLHKLLDALGELSATQQQLREAPIYLVALSLRHIQQQQVEVGSLTDGGEAALSHVASLSDLGQRVASMLSYPDTLTEDAVKYARAAASSLLVLLAQAETTSTEGTAAATEGGVRKREASKEEARAVKGTLASLRAALAA